MFKDILDSINGLLASVAKLGDPVVIQPRVAEVKKSANKLRGMTMPRGWQMQKPKVYATPVFYPAQTFKYPLNRLCTMCQEPIGKNHRFVWNADTYHEKCALSRDDKEVFTSVLTYTSYYYNLQKYSAAPIRNTIPKPVPIVRKESIEREVVRRKPVAKMSMADGYKKILVYNKIYNTNKWISPKEIWSKMEAEGCVSTGKTPARTVASYLHSSVKRPDSLYEKFDGELLFRMK